MGRACCMNGGEEESIQDICGKARRKETTGKTKTQVGGSIKMDLRGIWWDGMDWIDLAQYRDWRRALVNMLMNFGFHKMLEVLACLHNWWLLKKGALSE